MRQGDPLSPFLFMMAMEYLSRLLKQLGHNAQFKFHPKYGKMNLIHLGFVDNLLLFCKGGSVSTQLLFDSFRGFSKASGLVANLRQSYIYCGGMFKAKE